MKTPARITKKFVLSFIYDRLDEYKNVIINDSSMISSKGHMYCKNSAKLQPMKLETLDIDTLEDILDLLLADDENRKKDSY